MKILIITMNIGRTAPGIVFERLIRGISEIHIVDLITSDYDPSKELDKVQNIDIIEYKEVSSKFRDIMFSLFNFNPADVIWAYKAKRKITLKYDLIFSLMSFHHYAAFIAGMMISKNNKIKHAVYLVDAVPAPIGWSDNNGYYRGVLKMMKKYLPKTDGLFSANKKMLEYQLTTFSKKKDAPTGVIYNPANEDIVYYDAPDFETYTFLYTGGIYRIRNPRYLLQAFKLLLKEFPESRLEFVGTKIASGWLTDFSREERKKIIFHPFTTNLSPYYKRSLALIDIDAEINNDVYISSKIINYLTVNRAIISETSNDSPSRELFKNIPSIIQCNHDPEEIVKAMKKVIIKNGIMNFNDRNNIIQKIKLSSVINELNMHILEITSN